MGVFSWFKKVLGGKVGEAAEGTVFNTVGDGIGGEIASQAAGAASEKAVDQASDAAAAAAKKKKEGGGEEKKPDA